MVGRIIAAALLFLSLIFLPGIISIIVQDMDENVAESGLPKQWLWKLERSKVVCSGSCLFLAFQCLRMEAIPQTISFLSDSEQPGCNILYRFILPWICARIFITTAYDFIPSSDPNWRF
ncbi:uncharacterized protein LOC118198362 isoform X2 [Stegodyphus dumicola]|uniref:uncharacterized protein LOC118198362 isoform X2 n=1 Tax=Stegodyphus dumicola TaxID=202533 RepID=UPI0015ADE824|nr:uncharacterized protein LOC118198362 isoform X2 [Stegodyphus dumicola]